MERVAPDGSPVDVYLALPAEPELGRVRSVLSPRSSVLDLGAGVGRLANPLAADGHAVVAVDESAEMLAHIVGTETVLGDVLQLDLGRRFDVVLALSHLINDRSADRRRALLGVCRRHLADHGRLVVQRYPPDWEPREGQATVGEVGVHLHDVRDCPGGFSAAVTYSTAGRSWVQRFDAAIVDDDELERLAGDADLEVLDTLDDTGAWMLLGPPESPFAR